MARSKKKPQSHGLPGDSGERNRFEVQSRAASEGDSSAAPQPGKEEGIGDAEWLARFKALNDYVTRIGAVQKSFRRYAIYEKSDQPADSGYRSFHEVGSFTITKTGVITTHGAIDPPTDDEQAKIAEEAKDVKNVKWPECFPCLLEAHSLPPALANAVPEDIFTFKGADGYIIMLQQRVEKKDGSGKYYVPWTYWSDNKWRRMEPEGLLPLWGLEQLKNAATIYLHEGAKAARFVRDLVNDTSYGKAVLKAHPWGEQLARAVHLGWIGGAMNPHRTDWGPIRRLAPDVKIYVVADNDAPGVDAVPLISQRLQRKLQMVRFDQRFPPGFDLADEWPPRAAFIDADGTHNPPSLDDMLRPATWATYHLPLPKGKKGRPPIALRPEFASEWVYSVEPEVFIHRAQPHRLYSDTNFLALNAPFSNTNTGNLISLLKKVLSSQVAGIEYAPIAANERVKRLKGGVFNTFRPSTILPKEGDIKPFLEYLEFLFPSEKDRHEVMRWIATLIARPGIRMRYGLLLVSEKQGVGKSTLAASILKPLLGEWNCEFPSEADVTSSAFNSWRARKRLVVISEIHPKNGTKLYDSLKDVITDDDMRVNEKYMPGYSLRNVAHVVACSNHKKALKLAENDRRWLVPLVRNEANPERDYWTRFHDYLNNGGLGHIAWWANEFVKTNANVVATGEHAPSTIAKEEMVLEQMTEGEQLAYDLAQYVVQLGKEVDMDGMPQTPQRVVFVVSEVRDWIRRERAQSGRQEYLENAHTIRKALIKGGLQKPNEPPPDPAKPKNGERRISINRRLEYVVANFEIGIDDNWEKLKAFHKGPDKVMEPAL